MLQVLPPAFTTPRSSDLGTHSTSGASSRPYRPRPQPPGDLRRAGTETAPREQLGDYYLYPLAERTTIANAQTKQVSFLDVSGVPAQKIYEFAVGGFDTRSEEHTSELQSLMRISYAVFCLKNKKRSRTESALC